MVLLKLRDDFTTSMEKINGNVTFRNLRGNLVGYGGFGWVFRVRSGWVSAAQGQAPSLGTLASNFLTF